jgi:hypothetical protein
MGLLTWDIPSSHTKEAESIYLPIILSIVSANDNFCPRDVNDRMLEFTLILSTRGDVTMALYIDIGDLTFVTIQL